MKLGRSLRSLLGRLADARLFGRRASRELFGRSRFALAVRSGALTLLLAACAEGDPGLDGTAADTAVADTGSADSMAAAPAPGSVPMALPGESPFVYPMELWDAEVEGETIVMVHVSEAGAVDSVYVLEPSGEAAFDSAAVAGAYEMKFTPARRDDRRVAMWARLPVRFNRAEAGNGGAR